MFHPASDQDSPGCCAAVLPPRLEPCPSCPCCLGSSVALEPTSHELAATNCALHYYVRLNCSTIAPRHAFDQQPSLDRQRAHPRTRGVVSDLGGEDE